MAQDTGHAERDRPRVLVSRLERLLAERQDLLAMIPQRGDSGGRLNHVDREMAAVLDELLRLVPPADEPVEFAAPRRQWASPTAVH